jgi:single-strand DNA-binding protein
MNKVILTGNLCRDIELKQTQGGKDVVTNCIAVQRDFKNANGEYESDFINIVAYKAQANYLSNYAKKGDRVELVGRWTVRKWADSDGTQHYANECVVDNIKAFSKAKEQEKPKANAMEEYHGDLPF